MNIEYYKIHKYIKKNILQNIIKTKTTITPSVTSTEMENIINKFDFDETTGQIILKIRKITFEITTKITSKIDMVTKYNPDIRSIETIYKNNTDSSIILGISHIESKPIATALVLAYIETHRAELVDKMIDLTSDDPLDKTKYLFEINADGSIKIYDKKTKEELVSVQTAINQKNEEAKKTMVKVCKQMFNVDDGLDNSECAKYFYFILGKSALGIVTLFGNQIKSPDDITRILHDTNIVIKYELLKKLGWKFRFTADNSKELISCDEWIKIVKIKDIETYMETDAGKQVKNLLIHFVDAVNENINFFSDRMETTTTDNNKSKLLFIKTYKTFNNSTDSKFKSKTNRRRR